MKTSDIEQRIEAVLEAHPQRGKAVLIERALQKEGLRLLVAGIDPVIVCTAFATHATALVAAQKMAGKLTPDFAELLAQDFVESVCERSAPGATNFTEAEELPSPSLPSNDVFVGMGSLADARLERVKLGPDYELMVEDIIGNFNHIVSQGVPPITALYAFTQAYALTLGQCLRADLPWPIAQQLLRAIMKNAQAAEKMLRTVTQ